MKNNNRKRAETIGRLEVERQAKRNSKKSPWRNGPMCCTKKAYLSRAELDKEPRK